jgi:hypothetical protein
VGTDVIQDWTQGVDFMRVLGNGVAVIQGLGTANGLGVGGYTVDAIGSDAESLDVSGANVVNEGVIVLRGLDGNDTVKGSSGADYVYGNAGTNVADLSSGGNDRVYFDAFAGKQFVGSFTPGDVFYVNKRVIDTFGGNAARALVAATGMPIMPAATSSSRTASKLRPWRERTIPKAPKVMTMSTA